MSGATEPYVVEIKRSARRTNGAASEWVARRGADRTFATKADARRWAVAISGDGPVRVQDAAPNDPDDVDGYLVADPLHRRRARAPGEGGTNATFDGLESEPGSSR